MALTPEQIIERRANAYSERLAPSRGFLDAFRKEHGLGAENWAEARRRARYEQEKSENAERIIEMVEAHPLSIRIRENINPDIYSKGSEVRRDMGMGLEPKGRGRRIGQILGALTSDMTRDNTRGFWWLLNAPQATAAVLTELAYGRSNKAVHKNTNKELFGTHEVRLNDGELLYRNPGTLNTAQRLGLVNSEGETRRGVRLHRTKNIDPIREPDKAFHYIQTNYAPTDVNSLLIPSGIAINAGLGLLSPFGGVGGYEAALPDKEDKTKTNNVIGEVATKYFLGRTGNLLPYDEFSKIRPDVSKDEYQRYKAFKFNKKTDLDLSDGTLTAPAAVLKYTDEGIHGPELQFLGRSLPATTALVPFAASVAGTSLGAITKRPIRGGLIGGMAGLAVGQIAGNLIEGERRRRNQAQNEAEIQF